MRVRTSQGKVIPLTDYVSQFAQDHKAGEVLGRLIEHLLNHGVIELEHVDQIVQGPWQIENVEGTTCPRCRHDSWAGDRCFHCNAVRLAPAPKVEP